MAQFCALADRIYRDFGFDYAIKLALRPDNRFGSDADWDKAETSPSLEQIAAADLVGKGITPVTKKLWLDSSTYPELPEKVEGVAIVDGKELVLINDDDFGIEGAKTRIVRLTMPSAAF